LQTLQRKYVAYPSTAASAGEGLSAPTLSANEVVLVAHGPPGTTALYHRNVFGPDDDTWASLDVGVQDPQHPDWTPDGSHMVFDAIDADGQRRIYVTHTAFYLQRVRNLQRFPELLGAGRSTL